MLFRSPQRKVKKRLSPTRLIVRADYQDLCRDVTKQLVSSARKAIDQRGVFNLALAGGSTPRGVYGALSHPEYCPQIDWTKTHLFWGDERWVPAGHGLHNATSAFEKGFLNVPIPRAHIHPIPTGTSRPSQSAARYKKILARHLRSPRSRYPVFDVILLGLGADGHVASLFPGDDALYEKRDWVRAVTLPGVRPPRITVTFPVINSARAVWVLVSGKEKQAVLKQFLSGKKDGKILPIERIRPTRGIFSVYADRKAAGGFRSGKFFPGARSAR